MLQTAPPEPNDATGALQDLQVLITASEVYPAMERAFLSARREIWAGYRVFDLSTKLRSDEGRAVGETWFDLIVHTLSRGVSLHFVLSDFDPVFAPELHRASWKARRAFIAAAEAAGPDAKLSVVNSTHAARIGTLPRGVLWPRVWRQVARKARELNRMPSDERARYLEVAPGLRQWLCETPGGTLRAKRWPPPPLIPGTHHQKMSVFDRERLCIGGLDLDERRYDDKDHRRARDETWHDVQVFCRGTVVDEAQRHLETFLGTIADGDEPPPTTRLLRTLSRRRTADRLFLGPKPVVSEIAAAHHDWIGRARQLIYLETQYFRDRAIAGALAKAARANPDLGLILVLPAAPEDVAFVGNTGSDARFGEFLQAECLKTVTAAFGDRAAVLSPVRPTRLSGKGRDVLCGSPIIYVHAKVSIFDDAAAIVSSANLNSRSLLWDTETGVALARTENVHHLRRRVFTHWLPGDAEARLFDIAEAPRAWAELARDNADCAPEDRRGFLVPHDPRPAQAFGRRLPGVPDAMV